MCGLGRERGAVAVIVALLLVALIGFGALVVDAGALYERRRQVQTAADGAALAGAQELPDQDLAAQKAIEYLQRNTVVDAGAATIEFPNSQTIKVTAPPQTVDYRLAPVIGFTSGQVTATATAVKECFEHTVPWAVVQSSVTPEQLAGNEEVLLKVGAHASSQGNFQSIVIPRTDTTGSGPTYELNIALGSTADLKVGGTVDTYPGNRPSELTQGLILGNPPEYEGLLAQGPDQVLHGTTYDPPGGTAVDIDACSFDDVFGEGSSNDIASISDILEPQCPRLVRVPLIDDWPAGSKPVEIKAFMWFFLKTPPPPTSGQVFEVTGLVFYLPPSAWPYRIRLIE